MAQTARLEALSDDADVLERMEALHGPLTGLIGARTSDEVAEVLATAARELTGATCARVLLGDTTAASACGRADCATCGDAPRPAPDRTVWRLRDGHVFLSAAASDDVTSRLMAWLVEQAGAALDRTRQDASLAVDALLRNERERSELVQVLAHDLRSPMTALHGFASLLANHWAEFDETRRRDLLAMIQRETGRMDRLVEDVAAAILGPSTSLPVRLQPVDVTAMLTDLAAAAQAASPGHTVRAVVAPGTPALQADPDRLDQVLRNLVENATRHTPTGTIVVLYAHRDHDHVEIVVADDGPGIPAAIADRVFERGERGDTATAGSGLGLHTARTLTEAMGGTLTLDMHLTHGAAFVARLPVAGPRLG